MRNKTCKNRVCAVRDLFNEIDATPQAHALNHSKTVGTLNVPVRARNNFSPVTTCSAYRIPSATIAIHHLRFFKKMPRKDLPFSSACLSILTFAREAGVIPNSLNMARIRFHASALHCSRWMRLYHQSTFCIVFVGIAFFIENITMMSIFSVKLRRVTPMPWHPSDSHDTHCIKFFSNTLKTNTYLCLVKCFGVGVPFGGFGSFY